MVLRFRSHSGAILLVCSIFKLGKFLRLKMQEYQTLEAKVSIQETTMRVYILNLITIGLSNFKNGMQRMEIQVCNRYPEPQVMVAAGLTNIVLSKR